MFYENSGLVTKIPQMLKCLETTATGDYLKGWYIQTILDKQSISAKHKP